MEIGRLCVKIAGRDAGGKCVVVDTVDDNYVLIDGDVRRKKCNIKHLEPLADTIDIKKGASHADVAAAFKKLKLDVWETKKKEAAEKPKRVRKVKEKAPEAKPKKEKKPAKKEEKPEEGLAGKV